MNFVENGGADEDSVTPPPIHKERLPEQLPSQTHDFKTTVAGVAGNMLEWYDFSVFGYFSDIIGKVFFPPQSGNSALIESFAVFGAAFLVRPVGGMIMGHIGDTIGRKKALETSVFLMAFPTFAMGCLPSYESAGWLSIVMLVLCRLLQGLSVGGQIMSSVVFTAESQDRSRWGLHGTFAFMASSLGVLVGSLVSYVLREILSDDQLVSWGWRLPFFMGIFGAVPAIYLKLRAVETEIPAEERGVEDVAPTHNALRETFRMENLRALIASTLVPMLPATTYYLVYVWLAMFMEVLVEPPVPHAFALNTAAAFFGGFIFCPLGGWIADVYGNRAQIMNFSGLCLALFSPILIRVIGKGDAAISFLCQLTLTFLLALFGGSMTPWQMEIFPASVRLTSMSIGYNIAVGICGGMTPSIATLLVDRFGHASPGYLVSAVALVSLIGLRIAPRPKNIHDGLAVPVTDADLTDDEMTDDDLDVARTETRETRSTQDEVCLDMPCII